MNAPNLDTQAIGLRLKAVRKFLGMKTQAQMAEFLGVAREAVSQWERGITTPSLPHLAYLKHVYGISVDFVINGDFSALRVDIARELKPWVDAEMEHGQQSGQESPN